MVSTPSAATIAGHHPRRSRWGRAGHTGRWRAKHPAAGGCLTDRPVARTVSLRSPRERHTRIG